jgi:mRNA-decapping enzyme subunit 2
LKVFQHCPLFSQWSAEHYTAAFAEFMAYKSRVPVRGAILLNDAMDECVLVKGWKKGANWSFPRGKINKDENDLDCAVREVYEETGFDLQAAGLVHDEKDMKYIEQTMREQHMKLFVFKGVPKSTHFEPRTRKEISKIEWYKLTDLPTLKKHKHQDSNGAEHAMNANKFYMVAPFLGQLKKWIAQEKKKEARQSSNLAAPPMVAEESEVEAAPIPAQVDPSPQLPSDLPEVTITRSQDATAQLKQLFNIGLQQQQHQPPIQAPPPSHMPQVDAAKSRSLLALLRGGSSSELQPGPHTPLEQTSFMPEVPRSPHHSHVRSPPQVQAPPPHFHVQSELPSSPLPRRQFPDPAWHSNQHMPFRGPPPGFPVDPAQSQPLRAPYHQTGDPDFARRSPPSQAVPVIPPASALPKLTQHTQTLLDVFKGTSPAPPQASPVQQAPAKQSLLDLFKQVDSAPNTTIPASPAKVQQISPLSSQGLENATLATTAPAQPKPTNAHQQNLLGLFSLPASTPSQPLADRTNKTAAELSATQENQASQPKPDLLETLLRQNKAERAVHKNPVSVAKEGETAATVNGPLNQPNFEAIVRAPKEDPNAMRRSPVAAHRTLYDPNQPVPVKIMARPETPKEKQTPKQTQGRSPKPPKAKMATSSPKRAPKNSTKEPSKPFQPQILKRPQTREGEVNTTVPEPAKAPAVPDAALLSSASMSREVSSEKDPVMGERKLSQAEAHKQTLLSLFGGPSPSAPKGNQTPSRVVSPLSMSQLVSPREEVPISALEPKSRVSSGTSTTGNPVRPGIEKRQTGAENKAFLLGFLGRMATQEG